MHWHDIYTDESVYDVYEEFCRSLKHLLRNKPNLQFYATSNESCPGDQKYA
nr:hypothetical protein [uncultured Campylobacter sp.]